jgi:hypothetical protein
VVLGFSKCNIGVTEVEFFGYVCSHKKYSLSAARRESIPQLPFPRNRREVQSVMGVASMFLKFTPNYSLLAAPLTDMTSKNFSWDESSWTADYRASFEQFKAALQESLTLHYPDYSLDWIIRGDASD